MSMYLFVFFFSSRRRHTRYWRDWSSDVCSSDLTDAAPRLAPAGAARTRRRVGAPSAARGPQSRKAVTSRGLASAAGEPTAAREGVGEGKRVDLGGRRRIKKKKTQLPTDTRHLII